MKLNVANRSQSQKIDPKRPLLVIGLIALLLCSACSRRPVLYENPQLTKAGKSAADKDIDDCMAQAKNAGAKSETAATSGREIGVGAASGAAISAVGSAIYDGSVSGRSVGAGAGIGAAGTIIHRMFRKRTDPLFESYVNSCLQKKGYELVGWN